MIAIQTSNLSLTNLPAVGTIVYHRCQKNADNTPQRWKITSIKRWKKDQYRLRVGLKNGLKNYGAAECESDLLKLTTDPRDVIPCEWHCGGGRTEPVMEVNGQQVLYCWCPQIRQHQYWNFTERHFMPVNWNPGDD